MSTTVTVDYFLQCQQPDGTWEQASSATDDLDYARERLALRQERMPEFEHRLVQRTVTKAIEPIPGQAAS